MNNQPYILIMAGGIGSRFWPASREHLPKQFLDITGSGKTLLQETVDRFLRFVPLDHIFVITHTQYKDLVEESIPGLKPEQIIGEPTRNNTAASVALGSMRLSKLFKEAVCIVAPADHVIHNEEEFERVLRLACQHALQQDSIITLGITPTRPDTGYGYIEFDTEQRTEVCKAIAFKEKPDFATATQYVKAGGYAWNAGIFIWKLSTILDAFKLHAAEIYDVLIKGMDVYSTDEEAHFIRTEYPKTKKIAVDYAILEKADNVFTIPCDIGWSDLGTWNSLYDQSSKDDHQNVTLSKPVFLEETSNILLLSQSEKLIVIKGLEDFIIVDTDDCLMIYPKSEEQSIKELKERLKETGFGKFL
jgi:mannose-1-phosphate guanylyltransferase